MSKPEPTLPPYHVICGPFVDPYREKVVHTYGDDPRSWQKALGENILFQWGVYDHPDSPRPVSLDEAGIRFFGRQLELAGLLSEERPCISRILDLGCGWGYILRYLSTAFPECERIDGVNISRRQLEYCAELLTTHGLTDRVDLYLCDACDVDLLPGPGEPYDLAIIRGVITHFSNDLFERSMSALAQRMRPGGLLIISENLYNIDPATYRSEIADHVDRLACGHRKTPEFIGKVMKNNSFSILDQRVLPKNTDVAHWLLEVRSNIETHFPDGVSGPLEELRVLAVNLSLALLTDKFSAYSIIARRDLTN